MVATRSAPQTTRSAIVQTRIAAIASTSISTFHAGSSNAFTTSVVFAGRVGEQLAVHGSDLVEVVRVDEEDARAHDVLQGRAGLA